MNFESWSDYNLRNQRQQAAAAAAPAPAPSITATTPLNQPTDGGPLAGLASAAGAVFQSPVVQGPLEALHDLARPAGAVRGFIGTPNDRLGGAVSGFTNPDAAPTGYDLNRQFGIGGPTGEQYNFGPLPFGPGDLAARGTELALDPLTYAPGIGWAGKGAGLLGTGIKLTAPMALDLARAPFEAANLLRRPGASLAELAATQGPEKLSVAEALAQNTADTLGRKLPVIPKVTDLISPAMRDVAGANGELAPLNTVLHANSRAADVNQAWADGYAAIFDRYPISTSIRDYIEGSKPASTLSADDLAKAGIVQDRLNQLAQRYQATYNQLEAAAPELAQKFKIEQQPNYMPGYVDQAANATGPASRPPIGSRRTFQYEKAFPTHAEGEATGIVYHNPSDELAMHFRDMGSKITDMETLIALQPYAKYVQDAAHPALSAARTATGLQEIPGTTYPGLWFDPADAAKIGNYLGREQAFSQGTGVGSALGRVSNTVGELRSVEAAWDLSYSFLQNMAMLAAHPSIGLATIIKGIQSLGDTTVNARTLSEPWAQNVMDKIPTLHIGSTETSQGVGLVNRMADRVGNVPVLGGIGRGFQQGIDRTQGAWDTMGNFARLQAADALKDLAVDPQTSGEIGAVLNHMTGVLSTRAMGVGPGQRALETGMLFAPNFMRASLALTGDLLGGNIARTEALNAISKMMVSGAWMYQHMADAAGQDAIWDPKDARFMTLDVAGQRVGVGGTYRSLANLMGKVAANPGEVLDLRIFDPTNQNPLLRFWRGRASVPVSKVWDIASHETFNGTPIDDNFGDLSKWAGTSFLPFAVGGFITEHGTPAQQAVNFGAQATGLRAFPEGVKDVRERVAMQGSTDKSVPAFGKPFDQLGPVEQAQVMNSAEVKALPQSEGRAFAPQRQISGYLDEYANGRDQPDPSAPNGVSHKPGVNDLAAQVSAGQLSKDGFRKAVASLQNDLGVLLEDAPKTGKAPSTQKEADRAKYMALVGHVDENGQPNYDAAEAFRASLPQESQDYIAARHLAFLESLNPQAKALMQELTAARQDLQPYRNMLKTNLERLGLWDQFVNANPVEQAAIQKMPAYTVATRLTKVQQDVMRLKNPQLDAELAAWYGVTPILMRRR